MFCTCDSASSCASHIIHSIFCSVCLSSSKRLLNFAVPHFNIIIYNVRPLSPFFFFSYKDMANRRCVIYIQSRRWMQNDWNAFFRRTSHAENITVLCFRNMCANTQTQSSKYIAYTNVRFEHLSISIAKRRDSQSCRVYPVPRGVAELGMHIALYVYFVCWFFGSRGRRQVCYVRAAIMCSSKPSRALAFRLYSKYVGCQWGCVVRLYCKWSAYVCGYLHIWRCTYMRMWCAMRCL